ncbi:chloride channel [Hyaloscypha sp. PMI_1271]|nr:chloride channel [Hyaloscypha sp. PMI_1271]
MHQDEEASEHTHFLSPRVTELSGRKRSSQRPNELNEASSIISSHVSKEERELAGTAVGERLPYNDYATIDWLHDLIKYSFRYRRAHSKKNQCQGWIAAALIGLFTTIVAFLVDVAEATLSDYKVEFCSSKPFRNKEQCHCSTWKKWSDSFRGGFGIYVSFGVLFSIVAGPLVSKAMYMGAGSGIPEIKTIFSGSSIPHFLDFKVLPVKAAGATFAVPLFPKHRDNWRKMREMLSVACSSGLSVAFGAPIGGVLFGYEEISTYFPRKVNYDSIHYLVFIFLGLAGGLFGGVFCKTNFLWSKSIGKYSVINHPVFELALVVLM